MPLIWDIGNVWSLEGLGKELLAVLVWKSSDSVPVASVLSCSASFYDSGHYGDMNMSCGIQQLVNIMAVTVKRGLSAGIASLWLFMFPRVEHHTHTHEQH